MIRNLMLGFSLFVVVLSGCKKTSSSYYVPPAAPCPPTASACPPGTAPVPVASPFRPQ